MRGGVWPADCRRLRTVAPARQAPPRDTDAGATGTITNADEQHLGVCSGSKRIPLRRLISLSVELRRLTEPWEDVGCFLRICSDLSCARVFRDRMPPGGGGHCPGAKSSSCWPSRDGSWLRRLSSLSAPRCTGLVGTERLNIGNTRVSMPTDLGARRRRQPNHDKGRGQFDALGFAPDWRVDQHRD